MLYVFCPNITVKNSQNNTYKSLKGAQLVMHFVTYKKEKND